MCNLRYLKISMDICYPDKVRFPMHCSAGFACTWMVANSALTACFRRNEISKQNQARVFQKSSGTRPTPYSATLKRNFWCYFFFSNIACSSLRNGGNITPNTSAWPCLARKHPFIENNDRLIWQVVSTLKKCAHHWGLSSHFYACLIVNQWYRTLNSMQFRIMHHHFEAHTHGGFLK